MRVELAGVAPTTASAFPQLLATAASAVQRDGWLAAPGVVFRDLLAEYDLSDRLPHVMWVPPFAYEELARLQVDDLSVHWLLAIPISEAERLLLVEEGYAALEGRGPPAQERPASTSSGSARSDGHGSPLPAARRSLDPRGRS